ncbi:MAG TPA: MMPL family transporter [Solirubrobacterales bacterium]|nr:MMPL family transporter [Solirubrobacterales bacterium]
MTLLARLAAFPTRRPRLIVGVWIVVIGVLAFLGRNVEQRLELGLPFVDGSQAERAQGIVEREFGGDYAMVVMLRGPRDEVERQGRALADRIERTPRMHAVSPWAPGAAIDGLRPEPGVAGLVVRVESHPGEAVSNYEAPVRRQVDAVISAPVRSSFAGLPVIGDSYAQASAHAATMGELIGIPILLLVLLLVFRSVIAAVLPVLVGGAVVMASRGLLDLLAGSISIDMFAVGVAGMMGLALGVDYSLLVVSRFREEQRHRDSAEEAVQVTVRATSRSVLPAGCGLALAMLVSMLVVPAGIASTVAITVLIVTGLSVLSAMCVTPALLTLLGPNLDRWSLPVNRTSLPFSLRWSRRLAGSRRGVVSIMVGLLLCALWALTLNTSVIDFELLPAGDSGRHQQEDVERGLGPGWIAPIEVVVTGRGGPVTSTSRLQALAAFQREAERDPSVAAVAGFSGVAKIASQLGGIEGDFAEQERSLGRLGKGIARLHDGAARSSGGLLQAAAGARALGSGLGAAHAGGGALANGLGAVDTGTGRLSEGLGQVDDGSGKLAEGASKASTGAGRLADGLARAKEGIGEIQGTVDLLESAMQAGEARLDELHSPLQDTSSQLGAAWQALQRMTVGRSDPEYAAAVRAVEEANRRLNGTDIRTGEQVDPTYGGVEKGVERADGQFQTGLYLAGQLGENGAKAVDGMKKLASASVRLDRGLRRLASASSQLSDGVAKLSQGGEKLSPAMTKLSEGAERLAGGLGQLESGAGQLAEGLGGGAQKSKLLSGGLRKIGLALNRQRGGQGGSQLDQLQTRSPGLFDSGYFILAGLDGSQPKQRDQLGFLINLERGGLAARMLVVPRGERSSPATVEVTERLERQAEKLARETGTDVVVGGIGPDTIEVNKALRGSSVGLRVALALVTFFVLLLVVRSLLLPIIAALLNVVTVSASFGLLAMLFNNSLLGGPGFVEATVIPGAVMVIFGLAIDYEVFVFARMREEYLRTGSPSAAIANGLKHTAPVVSGAALIMIAVFLAFAVSDFMVIRNFAVVQAIAVFLDAFIIRLVMIPALMGWLGKWSWWMPGWLDRLLPGGGQIALGPDGQAPARSAGLG